MLVWALADQPTSLQGFALIFGALQGGFVALLPAFVADSFGSRSVGGVVGLLYTSRGIALLAGMPLLSIGVTTLGTHDVPVAICGLVGLLGTALLALAKPPSARGAHRHRGAATDAATALQTARGPADGP
jgi:hypothetical protein